MKQVRIIDTFDTRIVHICVGQKVYHAAVAPDAYSAECLETGDRATGKSRQESLDNLAALIVSDGTHPVFGVIG